MSGERASAISGPVIAHRDLPPLPKAGVVAANGDIDDAPDSGVVRTTFRDRASQVRFEKDGFAVIPFLTSTTIREIAQIYTTVGPAPGDERTGYFPGNVSHSTTWKRDVIEAVTPIIADRIDELFDRHHVFHLTFMTKWPGPDGKLQIHQDPTMVDQEGRFRSINVWCPLAISRPGDQRERGMVRVIPGSTNLATAGWYRARGGHIPSGLELVEHLAYEELARPVDLDLGEALVLDHRLVHCSPPNTSDEPRVVLAVGLRPEESPSIHVECSADGWVDFYEVNDEYFIRHPQVDITDYPRLRHFRCQDGPQVTFDELASLLEITIDQPCSAEPDVPEIAVERSNNRRPDAEIERQPRSQRFSTSVESWSHQWSWRHWLPANIAPAPRGATPTFGSASLDHRLRRDGFARVPFMDPRNASDLGDALRADATLGRQTAEAAIATCVGNLLPGWGTVCGTFEHATPFGANGVNRGWMFTHERAGVRSCRVIAFLDDVDGDGGMVQVARGSHRLDRMLRGTNLTAPWLLHDGVWPSRLLNVPARRGDALIIDSGLVTAWLPDRATRPHVAITVVATPPEAALVHFRRVDGEMAERHELSPDFFVGRGLVPVSGQDVARGDLHSIESVELGPNGLARRLDSQPLALLDRIHRALESRGGS